MLSVAIVLSFALRTAKPFVLLWVRHHCLKFARQGRVASQRVFVFQPISQRVFAFHPPIWSLQRHCFNIIQSFRLSGSGFSLNPRNIAFATTYLYPVHCLYRIMGDLIPYAAEESKCSYCPPAPEFWTWLAGRGLNWTPLAFEVSGALLAELSTLEMRSTAWSMVSVLLAWKDAVAESPSRISTGNHHHCLRLIPIILANCHHLSAVEARELQGIMALTTALLLTRGTRHTSKLRVHIEWQVPVFEWKIYWF